jgi:hypothetical protein
MKHGRNYDVFNYNKNSAQSTIYFRNCHAWSLISVEVRIRLNKLALQKTKQKRDDKKCKFEDTKGVFRSGKIEGGQTI